MSSNHESQSLYAENEAYIKREERLNKVYFIANMVAGGFAAGAAIGLVLDITLGSTVATGAGTMLGGTLGGLIGAILLFIKRRRSDAEPPGTIQGSGAETPHSV